MFIGLDPLYWIMLAPAMLLAFIAQSMVKSRFAWASKYAPSSRLSGAEAAQRILDSQGLRNVKIERAKGLLGDHYDPRSKTLRLSPDVYAGRSLAAVGVAAHEVGHAIQDSKGYAPLKLRNGIVPLASVGSGLSMMIFIAGIVISSMTGSIAPGGAWGIGQYLMVAAILLFSVNVVFQLINLPVEFNASSRARSLLVSSGVINAQEDAPVAKVLNAAALTYVAATLSAILTLLYLVLRSGLLRRD